MGANIPACWWIILPMVILSSAVSATTSDQTPSTLAICVYKAIRSQPKILSVDVAALQNRFGSWISIEYTFRNRDNKIAKASISVSGQNANLDGGSGTGDPGFEIVDDFASKWHATWSYTDQVVVIKHPIIPTRHPIDMSRYK